MAERIRTTRTIRMRERVRGSGRTVKIVVAAAIEIARERVAVVHPRMTRSVHLRIAMTKSRRIGATGGGGGREAAIATAVTIIAAVIAEAIAAVEIGIVIGAAEGIVMRIGRGRTMVGTVIDTMMMIGTIVMMITTIGAGMVIEERITSPIERGGEGIETMFFFSILRKKIMITIGVLGFILDEWEKNKERKKGELNIVSIYTHKKRERFLEFTFDSPFINFFFNFFL